MRFRAVLVAALAVGLIGGTATAATAVPQPKVWVCKYVGTPNVDERLKNGKNPISVSANSTDGTAVGSFFNDAQGRSFVLAIDTGQDPATLPPCPRPDTPPPCQVNCEPVVYTIEQIGAGHCDTQGFAQTRFAIRPKTFPQPQIAITGGDLAQQGDITQTPNAWVVHAISLGGAGGLFSGTVTITVDGTAYVVPFVIQNRALCPAA